jgi:uncharacterized coiled-coil protein SlyX
MTLDNFLDNLLGESWGYPDNNSFKGECLSIVKIYIKECFGINPPPSGTNSAYGYWTNFPNPLGTVFEKVENTPELIPEKGWIAIWKPWEANPYGHIAICANGSTTGTLKNWAQNWTSKVFQLESNRYTNVVGYLKPKCIIPIMTEDEKRILEFVKEKNLTEGQIREAIGWLFDKTVARQEEEIKGLKATISDQYKEMDKKNLEYGKLLEEFNILMAKYQALLESESLYNDTIKDKTVIELIKIIISKLFSPLKS